MKNVKIKILNKEGNLIEYNVILTFKCKTTNKSYIIYEGENTKQLFVANYDPDNKLSVFNPININDFNIVKTVLNRI